MKMTGWQDTPMGGAVLQPGSSREVNTGAWGVVFPEIDLEACVHCMICWAFCPDSCFLVAEGKLVSVDYDHCKGCGICAVECPKKCIKMVEKAPVGV